jgi:hypothetical protein
LPFAGFGIPSAILVMQGACPCAVSFRCTDDVACSVCLSLYIQRLVSSACSNPFLKAASPMRFPCLVTDLLGRGSLQPVAR